MYVRYSNPTTMKSLFTLVIVCLISLTSWAQTDSKTEINRQIWEPFIQAYTSFNTEKFMSLYTTDVIRIPLDQDKIFSFSEYKKEINRENQFNKNYNIKLHLEIHFSERIHTATTAYESGIYKIHMIENTGKEATVYSKFQVILKKVNGQWKIATDIDSAEGSKLTEKDFMAAKAMN